MTRIPNDGWRRARDKLNTVITWAQGYFIDFPAYRKMTEEWKNESRARERLLVRPSPTGNAICTATDPEMAQWIARRLNLAAHYDNAGTALTAKDAHRLVDEHRLEFNRLQAAFALGAASRQAEFDALLDKYRELEAFGGERAVEKFVSGIHELHTPVDGFDRPEDWDGQPFARMVWEADGGEASVGIPAYANFVLAEDQTGTTVGEMLKARGFELIKVEATTATLPDPRKPPYDEATRNEYRVCRDCPEPLGRGCDRNCMTKRPNNER